jgi:AcrR family transcriptional regulator
LSKPHRQTHRDALLNAARTLLRESGGSNITARDLVAVSKTNLGSIAYHFGSKDALLEEACKLVFEEWAVTVARAMSADPGAPPVRRLARSLEMILDEFDAMRPYFLGFIEIVVRSQGSSDAREQLVAHYLKQRATVAGMVTASLGDAVGTDDAAHIASLLMAISDGLMLQSLIDPLHVPTSHQLTAASASALKALKQRG